MAPDVHPGMRAPSGTRREFLTLTAAGAAALGSRLGTAAESNAAGEPGARGRARISIRIPSDQWLKPARREVMLAFVQEHRDTIDEVALFTALTHPPLPLADVESRATVLRDTIPQFQALGLPTGINHLATIGHLDENLEYSLREPWQHLVDFDGGTSASCYCPADPRMQQYVRRCYAALAAAKPDFLWVDDDVRLEGHGPIRFACFCDRCMATFSAESGTEWTRASLVAALRSGSWPERLALRRRWLSHNRDALRNLMRTVREAVDGVDPTIPLGLMTAEVSYSGYGFDAWAAALAGPRNLPVKWRPGGGFYTDDTPVQLLDKAHSTGRQIALLPDSVTEIPYEHENFPYQQLKKSVTIFTAEIAAAIGAGCTGAALNCLGVTDDPVDEYRPYLAGVRRHREFYDKAAATFGRTACTGVWPAFTRDHFAVLEADGDWFAAPAWGGDLRGFAELAEIGLPTAYGRKGARVAAFSGDGILDFSERELLELLAGGLILDVPALARLHELGLGRHAGFAVRGRKDKDTIERFSRDPLNGRFAGWHRDCRPSFYPGPARLIEPLSPQARPLAELVDFAGQTSGPCSGVFENDLGGRVAVFGYYPWRALQSLAKASQLKAVCRWLSRDTLPAFVDSYVKAALWCRQDANGRPAMLLLNASLDSLVDVCVHVLDADRLELTRFNGQVETRPPSGRSGPYAAFTIPGLGPWEPVLLTAK